jgi:hypothetical protein
MLHNTMNLAKPTADTIFFVYIYFFHISTMPLRQL